MSNPATLTKLIAPYDLERFLAEDYERAPRYIAREPGSWAESLVTFDDIERVITTLRPPVPDRLNVVCSEREIDRKEYTFPSGLPNAGQVFALYQEGATIILSSLHMYVPKLYALVRGMEHDLSCRAQTNIYVTPPGSQGFASHYDNHDVFCIQTSGLKVWQFHRCEPAVVLPFQGEQFSSETHQPAEHLFDVTAERGSTLYIPRGYMHDAKSSDEPSIHVTLGTFTRPWSEIVLEAVARVASEHVAFRRSAPRDFAREGFDYAEHQATFQELLELALKEADGAGALTHFARNLVQTRVPLAEDQLRQSHLAEALTTAMELGARPDLMYRIDTTEDSVTVLCHGDEHTFPLRAEGLVRQALSTAHFRVSDVTNGLDGESAVVVLQHLIHAGCLRVLEPGSEE